MPKTAPEVKPDAKRPRLTLSELASYDDICTDALVDNIFFWSTIRKNRQKYNSGRGFSEDAVTKIIYDHIVCEEDVKSTESDLLKLTGFKRFLERLRTPREQEDFRRHLRKYINIWLPDCPWEVTTTNRYTIITHEAAVVARRDIKKGETITYLCGTLVEMTYDEEKDLNLTRRDFSIVTSSRSKKTSLFLGPARFANHDCRANARLTTTGLWGMSVVAVQPIYQGEEITVTYGDDYFGMDNCECLCGSCEQAGIGGWTKSQTIPTVEKFATPDDDLGSYSFRRRRRNQRGSYSPTTPDPDSFLSMRKTRPSLGKGPRSGSSTPTGLLPRTSVKSSLVRVSSVLAKYPPKVSLDNAVDDQTPIVEAPVIGVLDQSVIDAPPLLLHSESELKQENGWDIDKNLTPNIKQEYTEEDLHLGLSRNPLKRSLTPEESEENLLDSKKPRVVELDKERDISIQTRPTAGISSHIASPAPSQNCDSKTGSDQSPSKVPQTVETQVCEPGLLSPHPDERERSCLDSRRSTTPESIFENIHETQVATPVSSQAEGHLDIESETKLGETISINAPACQGILVNEDSDLSELDSDEDFDDKISQIVHRKKRRTLMGKTQKQTVETEAPETAKIRYPGDYVMTPVLLAEPFARWVQCRTCKSVWVQANGYYTRRECPRCERHSKLYGYQWPKVHDEKVERVSDHRTVHRFLSATEEDELRSTTRVLQEAT